MAFTVTCNLGTMMNYWGDLPTDLVRKIAEHIEFYEDYESFGQICSQWRRAMKDHKYMIKTQTQLPWLMLTDLDDGPYRRYYSATKRMFRKFDLPQLVLESDRDNQIRRFFSSQGWLISVSLNSLKITLFDPFSNNCDAIQLPAVPNNDDYYADYYDDDDDDVDIDDRGSGYEVDVNNIDGIVGDHNDDDDVDEDGYDSAAYERSTRSRNESEGMMRALLRDVRKFALSAAPSKSKANYGDDFVVAVIYESDRHVAFWRPGQDEWIKPSVGTGVAMVCDVCFFRGECYRINRFGDLLAWDLKKPSPRIVSIAHLCKLATLIEFDNLYIVGVESEYEGQGSYLLVVKRYTCVVHAQDAADTTYETKLFKVFKVDLDTKKAQEIKDLGNRAIFVGFNHTFSVKTSTSTDDGHHKHECQANCIYFTDDVSIFFKYHREGGGGDNGIYNLALDEFVHHRHPFYEGPAHLSKINPPMWVQLS